jgi:hypothetical protein
MFVCCECCVLSGRGLCDELITSSDESYRLWCVVVCDLENLRNEEAMTLVGSQRHSKKKSHYRLSRYHNFSFPTIDNSNLSVAQISVVDVAPALF